MGLRVDVVNSLTETPARLTGCEVTTSLIMITEDVISQVYIECLTGLSLTKVAKHIGSAAIKNQH